MVGTLALQYYCNVCKNTLLKCQHTVNIETNFHKNGKFHCRLAILFFLKFLYKAADNIGWEGASGPLKFNNLRV